MKKPASKKAGPSKAKKAVSLPWSEMRHSRSDRLITLSIQAPTDEEGEPKPKKKPASKKAPVKSKVSVLSFVRTLGLMIRGRSTLEVVVRMRPPSRRRRPQKGLRKKSAEV